MEKELQVFDDIAARVTAAYRAHKTIYEAKNPPPRPPISGWRVQVSNWTTPAILCILVLASVIVSASRTIPEFGGNAIGVSAFVMLECTVVFYAFIRTKNDFNEERLKHIHRWINAGLLLAFIVLVATNIHAELKKGGVQVSEHVNTAILLVLAISAPTLAFVSGDVMAMEYMKNVERHKEEKTKYATAYESWEEGLNRSWAAQQGKWKVSIEQLTTNSLNEFTEPVNERRELPVHTYSPNSASGYSKRMDARSLIHEFFEQYPERMNSRLDELVIQIEQEKGVKVGRTSIHNVRREMLQ